MLRISHLVTRLSSAGLLPLVTGGSYFLAAVAVLHLTRGADGIATLWPSSGILFAALLIAPARRFPAHVLAGTLASLGANLVSGIDPLMSLGFTAANVLEAVVGTWLLRSRGPSRVPFVDPKSLVAFCVASTGGAAISALIATFVFPFPSTGFWFSWFSTDLLGIWVVAPLILIVGKLLAIDQPRVCLQTGTETAGVFTLVAVVAALTFWQASYPLLFLPMLAILLAVFRLGPIGAAGGVLVVATISSIAISFGHGPPALADVGGLARNLFVQFYLVALFAAALPIATLLSARSRLIDELAEKMRLLQLAEGAAQVGHWRLDVSSGAVTWSDEVFRIHGLPNDRVPCLVDAITRYHPDDQDTVTRAIKRAVDEHGNFELMARIVRPDSEVRNVLVKGEIDRPDHRSRLAVFGIMQDVTDRIAYEANLQAARSRAESAAREAMLMAETDPLTGIANRRRTSALLDQAVLASHGSGEALSVAIFDIDHFKHVNDTYGHQAGDEVLKRIVGNAAASIRSGDILGRFGGEEFVIVLPAAAAHIALQVARRVRAAVEAASGNPRVTISVGVAELVAGETSEMLFRRADQALYAAKHAGRNAVRWAT